MRTPNIRPIGPRNQVTIPPEMLRQFEIRPGDIVKFVTIKQGILMKPVTVVEKEKVLSKSEIDSIEKLINKQTKAGKYVEISGRSNAISYLKRKIKK